ncbi:penicillin acylase family protein [Maribacter sp. 2307ULW6-5]|uniref:penicillin acylase family protein n=1 Tax=Maribacter sp. 2307ULW6-5 TaxID=3386275 RepID=UPI0039BD4032
MKTVKKIGLALLLVLVVAAVGLGVFVGAHTTDYSGEKTLSSLAAPVEVYHDAYGIPHIYAQEEADAFRALGYLHAQERLWQMELLRRIATGRLSEVFGPDLLETDKFMLTLGIDDATVATVARVDRNSPGVRLTEAYLDGVNQFVAVGYTPVEYHLTGLEKTPFALKDVYNTLGYMAFSFAMAHKTDPLLTQIKEEWGADYLKDLETHSSEDLEWIKTHDPAKARDTLGNSVAGLVHKALGPLGIPLFEGSNSWVLAPEKTKNGKVIFTNDPHIGFAQPSVWFEAHLETPTYHKYGYHLGGIPFPLLGHSRQLAYGMTMFQNDDVNFYYEDVHPQDTNKYRWGGAWKTFETVSKTIAVKDGEDVAFSYKKSEHGPILNGIARQVTGERPVAMSWVYTQKENQVMDALYELSHAQDLSSFQKALPKVHAPGLNIMYGDAEGNVGWFATAALYRIPDSVNTKLVFEPGQGLPLQKDWLPFSANPKAVNPPWHYVYSANNQPDSIAGMLYPGYYLPENRGRRIVELLEPKNNWDLEATKTMLTDVSSSVNREVATNFSKLMDVADLTENQLLSLDTLALWDGNYPLGSVAATLFTRWEYRVLENTFADEMGKTKFEQFLGTHFQKRVIAPMSGKPESVWWDNSNTPDSVETQKGIVQTSFLEAIASLEQEFGPDLAQWTWDKVHTLEHPHPIGQVAALRGFFNVGPFPIHGTREVINNMAFNFDGTGHYKTSSGPSTRRIVDFSDVENGYSILPTGQSGNPFSKHYKDQAALYNAGGYRKMMMNEAEIKNASELLIFKPKE